MRGGEGARLLAGIGFHRLVNFILASGGRDLASAAIKSSNSSVPVLSATHCRPWGEKRDRPEEGPIREHLDEKTSKHVVEDVGMSYPRRTRLQILHPQVGWTALQINPLALKKTRCFQRWELLQYLDQKIRAGTPFALYGSRFREYCPACRCQYWILTWVSRYYQTC